MKKLLILTSSILIGLTILSLLPVRGEARIYDSVIRLHVRANSNSEYDQSLKLKVRDEVLLVTSEIIGECETREGAELSLRAALAEIEMAAVAVIEREGANYPVKAELSEEVYPRKSYDGICFPAGKYMSLSLNIGEAEGENWWCVLFPKLCIKAATKKTNKDACIEAGLTPAQYRIITETGKTKYTVRFKVLELIEQLFRKGKQR